jgi:hypothetical protein
VKGMRKSYVMKSLFLGVILMLGLFSYDMEAQAKSFDESPSVNVEAIHERNASDFSNDSLSDGNSINDGMNPNSNAGRKEWGASKENLEEVPVTSEKISIVENNDLEESSGKEIDVRTIEEQEEISDDSVLNLFGEDNRQIDSEKIWSYVEWVKLPFLDLQERNDLSRSWVKNRLVNQVIDISEEWTRVLQDKTLLGMQESWDSIFDSTENLDSAHSRNEEKDQRNHQNEDRWFIFDAKNQEESKEKESKKKKVKQKQTRNGKNLETGNKVYVNTLIRVRMELVYFACAKEHEWIVRRETLF